jgi:uncharacterized membrane protein
MMRKRALRMATFALLAAFAGCADLTSRERRVLTGTAVGAGGGALIGAATGHPGAGAAIGGAAGAVGGYLYDREKKDRR